jgi:hypothetical protein
MSTPTTTSFQFTRTTLEFLARRADSYQLPSVKAVLNGTPTKADCLVVTNLYKLYGQQQAVKVSVK